MTNTFWRFISILRTQERKIEKAGIFGLTKKADAVKYKIRYEGTWTKIAQKCTVTNKC
jgi:hypothetical protein